GADGKVSDCSEVLAVYVHGRMQLHRIRARHRTQPVVLTPHPGHDAAIAEAQYQLHVHTHPSAIAPHQTYDVYIVFIVGEGHEVDQGDLAFGGLEGSLQYGGA